MQWDIQTPSIEGVPHGIPAAQATLRGRVVWRLQGNIGALATKCKPKQKITSTVGTIRLVGTNDTGEASPVPKDPTLRTSSEEEEVEELGFKLLVFPKGHVVPQAAPEGEEQEYEPSVGLELFSIGKKNDTTKPLVDCAEFDREVAVSLAARCDISNATDGSGKAVGEDIEPPHGSHKQTYSSTQRVFPLPGQLVRYDTLRYSESLTVVVDIALLRTAEPQIQKSAGWGTVMGSVGSVIQSVKDHSPLPTLVGPGAAAEAVENNTPGQQPQGDSSPEKHDPSVKQDGEGETTVTDATLGAASAFRFIGATLAEAASAVTNTSAEDVPSGVAPTIPKEAPRSHEGDSKKEAEESTTVSGSSTVAPPSIQTDGLTETEEALWTLLFSMLQDPERLPIIELLCSVDCLFFACDALPQVEARGKSEADDVTSHRTLDATDPPPSELRLALQTCDVLKAKRFSLVPRYIVEGEFWYNFLNNLAQVFALRHLADLRVYLSSQSQVLHKPGGVAALRRKPLPPSGITKVLCDAQIEGCLVEFRHRVEGKEHHKLTKPLGDDGAASLGSIRESLLQFEELLRASADSATTRGKSVGTGERDPVPLFSSPNSWGDAASPSPSSHSPVPADTQLSAEEQLGAYKEILSKLETVPGLEGGDEGTHPTLGPMWRELKECVSQLEEVNSSAL